MLLKGHIAVSNIVIEADVPQDHGFNSFLENLSGQF